MSDPADESPDEPAVAAPDPEVDAVEDIVSDVADNGGEEEGWIGLGGDVSLDMDEATVVAAHLGATVVLVAGNREAGKTTLLVELYARFLDGPFCGLEFAGSETLDAFDARHFGSRVDSGNDEEDMEHTEDVDTRFLHLRLAGADGKQRALLLTDLMGELFSDLAEGADVASRVPIAHRADKALLMIDGAEILEPSRRQVAVRDAKLVLGALTEPLGIPEDTPLQIVLTKADLLEERDVEWFRNRAEELVEFAATRGLRDVTSTVLAARPRAGASRQGLDALTAWMWSRPEPRPVLTPEPQLPFERVFVTASMRAE